MAVEQIRPDRRAEQGFGSRRKILTAAQGLRFFSESPGRTADSFIPIPRYVRNEGMPEGRLAIQAV
jgi:hypothetical protein